MLPDFMVPYKQYPEETIAGVLDEVVLSTDSDSEDFPSESTMKRWKQWFIRNMANMDGHIRSVAHRMLGFSQELLYSDISYHCSNKYEVLCRIAGCRLYSDMFTTWEADCCLFIKG